MLVPIIKSLFSPSVFLLFLNQLSHHPHPYPRTYNSHSNLFCAAHNSPCHASIPAHLLPQPTPLPSSTHPFSSPPPAPLLDPPPAPSSKTLYPFISHHPFLNHLYFPPAPIKPRTHPFSHLHLPRPFLQSIYPPRPPFTTSHASQTSPSPTLHYPTPPPFHPSTLPLTHPLSPSTPTPPPLLLHQPRPKHPPRIQSRVSIPFPLPSTAPAVSTITGTTSNPRPFSKNNRKQVTTRVA